MRDEHLSAERIQDLLDGRVSAEEARTLSAHVDGCARCTAQLSAFGQVFTSLGALPPLTPESGFADRVMDRVVPRGESSDLLATGHVRTESLVEYLDGAMAPAAHAVVERHLAACSGCKDREAEWSIVFRQLSAVERLAPAEGFRERVLARLPAVLPAVAPERKHGNLLARWSRTQMGAVARRLALGGRRRWAVVAGLGTAPATVAASVAWVVLSHPLVTARGLMQFAWLQATQLASTVGGTLLSGVMESAATYQLWAAIQGLASTPLAVALGVAAVCAVLSSSVWVLVRTLGPVYRNLIPVRLLDGRYARANV